MPNPVFILSTGPLAGCGQLQRLLSAGRQTMVLGAPEGALNHFLEGLRRMDMAATHSLSGVLGGKRIDKVSQQVVKPGDDIAPHATSLRLPSAHARHTFRRFLGNLYGAPAKAHGFSSWGLAEPGGTKITADMLRFAFPEAKFVFVTRHPLDCLGAIKSRRMQPKDAFGNRVGGDKRLAWFAQNWVRQATDFFHLDYGLKVRIEDLATGDAALSELAAYLELTLPEMAGHAAERPGRKQLSAAAIERLLPVLKEKMLLWGYE